MAKASLRVAVTVSSTRGNAPAVDGRIVCRGRAQAGGQNVGDGHRAVGGAVPLLPTVIVYVSAASPCLNVPEWLVVMVRLGPWVTYATAGEYELLFASPHWKVRS